MDLPTAIEKYWGHATAVAVGLFTFFKAWSDLRAKRREAVAATVAAEAVARLDLTKLAQEAAKDVVQILRDEVDHWTGEVAKLREELRDARREHAQVIAQKDAQIALLEGEKRNLQSQLDAYHRAFATPEYQKALADHGLPEPKVFTAHQVQADGRLTTMGES